MSQRQRDREIVQLAAEVAQPLAASGHVFTHTWLAEALALGTEPQEISEFKRWEMRRNRLVIEWTQAMLDIYGVVLKNRQGQGYVVVPPKDVATVVEGDHTREAMKELLRGAKKLMGASVTGLTPQEIAQRRDAFARISAKYVMLKSSRRKPPQPGTLRTTEMIEAAARAEMPEDEEIQN